jgi:hypothetical protein
MSKRIYSRSNRTIIKKRNTRRKSKKIKTRKNCKYKFIGGAPHSEWTEDEPPSKHSALITGLFEKILGADGITAHRLSHQFIDENKLPHEDWVKIGKLLDGMIMSNEIPSIHRDDMTYLKNLIRVRLQRGSGVIYKSKKKRKNTRKRKFTKRKRR